MSYSLPAIKHQSSLHCALKSASVLKNFAPLRENSYFELQRNNIRPVIFPRLQLIPAGVQMIQPLPGIDDAVSGTGCFREHPEPFITAIEANMMTGRIQLDIDFGWLLVTDTVFEGIFEEGQEQQRCNALDAGSAGNGKVDPRPRGKPELLEVYIIFQTINFIFQQNKKRLTLK